MKLLSGLLGGAPALSKLHHVGEPNLGDRDRLMGRFGEMLDRRWFSNNGPLVHEFERRICEYVGVDHCVAMCNATIALAVAVRALNLQGEVIVPSFTFVATAHALQWQGITPVFTDIDPATHNLDPAAVAARITPRTSAILGVHVWGRGCDTAALEELGARHGIPVIYDAAHAFGCTHEGRMIGQFGSCEVYSFHATKFLNSFEGGAVVTNDAVLAQKFRDMRNFGFSGYDRVVLLGINGKMTEACAAMGLTSLEIVEDLVTLNEARHTRYRAGLEGLPGLSLVRYPAGEKNNHQYVVVEVDPEACPLTRNELVEVLHAENVLARKYFWPCCHRMEPYRSLQPGLTEFLPHTEAVAEKILILPNGQAVSPEAVETICGILKTALDNPAEVRKVLRAGKARSPQGGRAPIEFLADDPHTEP